MNIGGNKTKCLVTDLDGTLIHNFLTSEENQQVYTDLIALSKEIEIVINTARSLDSVVDLFQIPTKHLEQLSFIVNGGQKIIIHGKELINWSSLSETIPALNNIQIIKVKNYILESGYNLEQYKFIDKFYINFKVNEPSLELITRINKELANENIELCYNQNSIKLISSKINKGTALKYLQNLLPDNLEYIGIGNSTLDKYFLKLCHKSFFINGKNKLNQSKFVSIKNREEHNRFRKSLLEILEK